MKSVRGPRAPSRRKDALGNRQDEQERLKTARSKAIEDAAAYFVTREHGMSVSRAQWDALVDQGIKARLGCLPPPRSD